MTRAFYSALLAAVVLLSWINYKQSERLESAWTEIYQAKRELRQVQFDLESHRREIGAAREEITSLKGVTCATHQRLDRLTK